mgnify:CR=1 FL=1
MSGLAINLLGQFEAIVDGDQHLRFPTAKARALLKGRQHATTDDVRAMALPVLRHRLALTFNAESEGVTVEQLIEKVI